MATKKKTDQDLQLDKDQLKASIVRHLRSTLGTSEQKASPDAWWKAKPPPSMNRCTSA
jgi:starch phosphorylase